MFRKFLNYANDPWMVTGDGTFTEVDGTVYPAKCYVFKIGRRMFTVTTWRTKR